MYRILLLLLLGSCLLSCQKDPVEAENLVSPTITKFYRDADTIGAVVHLLGSQFSKTPENNIVSFNGTEATAFAVHGDTLRVHVPRGARTGLLTLRVYQQTVTSASPFTVLTGHWKLKGKLPSKGQQVEGFELNGKTYLYELGTNHFWSYDPLTNRWTPQADFPSATRSGTMRFTLEGEGYIGCGINRVSGYPTNRNDFYAYDPRLNRWTRKADAYPKVPGYADYPMDREHAVSFAVGGKGYVICTDYSYQARVMWEYTPQTNTWARKGSFPGVPRYRAGGMAIGNKGYIGGGTTGGSPILQDFWEYDPQQNTWTRTANYPGGFPSQSSCFTAGSKVYVSSPSYRDNQLMELWEFTP